MDTNILTPKNLFQKDIHYVIPTYQRPYVWDVENRCAPLWDDVQRTAEEYLDNLDKVSGKRSQAEGLTTAHFLGAVVLQQEQVAVHEVERRIVVDGQQRIITLQLLLDAAQEVFAEQNLYMGAKRLAKLVLNDEELYSGTERFKLWPSEGDRDAFKHAMHNGLATDDYKDSRIVIAHEYFQTQTKDWISNETDVERRASALEAAITALFQLVVIDLWENDDPHVIFETLNARGTPLLQSDLIKNFVVSKAPKDMRETIWGGFGNKWWREEVQQGRLRVPRIEMLTNYWLVMRTATEVSANNLFKAFQDYYKPKSVTKPKDISIVMKDMNYVLKKFRDFEESSDLNEIEDLFRYRMGVMQTGVITPILLRLLSSDDISSEELDRALRALESYLVRRMVCRETTKDYNSVVLALLKNLGERGLDNIGVTIPEFLREQDADARLWPPDKDIYDNIGTRPLYRQLTRGRLRLVLEGIERQLRVESLGKAEELNVKKGLTIEHVMPRGWKENWQLPTDEEPTKAEETREGLIHTLGNLTLTTQRLNTALSNAYWQTPTESNVKSHGKRKTLECHSVLYLNKALVQMDLWDEDSIIARGKELAEAFIRVWPGPNSPEWY